jgi:tetraacyldisaccharide 4'-kinase
MESMRKFLGKIYGGVSNLRNALYDRGVLTSYSLGAKTISIGNLTTGGTGKTPLVAYVAEILADAGETVCILTRGYGRESSRRVLVSDRGSLLVDARIGGDEPVELARKLIGKAIVVADADRVSAARWAKEKYRVTAFVLDDGFQHRRARRDIDVVCIDATNPFGGGRVLPAGTLREPVKNLARADVFVITRGNLVDSVHDLEEQLRSSHPDMPIFISRTEIVSLTKLGESVEDGSRPNWNHLRAHGAEDEVRTLAFCALGNPEAFFTQVSEILDDELMKDEFDLTVVKQFPDHHRYTQSDIKELERQARAAGLHALLTTGKDAVKLEGLKFDLPCYVVDIEVRMDDADRFRDLVLSS